MIMQPHALGICDSLLLLHACKGTTVVEHMPRRMSAAVICYLFYY